MYKAIGIQVDWHIFGLLQTCLHHNSISFNKSVNVEHLRGFIVSQLHLCCPVGSCNRSHSGTVCNKFKVCVKMKILEFNIHF